MTLQRKIRRSVGKKLSFYLTGSVLTAITIMLVVGAFAVSRTLYDRYDRYFAETKVEDGYFTTGTAISDAEQKELEDQYQVELEPQQYINLNYQDTKFRLFAETQQVDLYTVTEGRRLETADEIVVTYKYAKANGIAVGDTLELAGKKFQVCGLGIKPDYAVMFYDFSESIANKEGFGIGIISREAMDRLSGAAEYYSVRYLDPKQEQAFRTEIYEKYGTQEYVEQKSNPRIWIMYEEADNLVAEFSLYSPIIMIIVVAVIAMVLARTVRQDGKTIGTLMALGYRKRELIRHYMVYGMIPAVAGDLMGILFSIPFSKAFCGFYFGDAEYIDYTVQFPWGLMVVALLIPVLVYGLVSYVVVYRALDSEIVPLLKGLREKRTASMLNGQDRKLAWTYNIRTIVLNRFRSITLIIGIAIATLCIVLGGSFQDAYDNLLEEKVPYAMLGGAYEYGFNGYMTENPYGGAAIFDISFGAEKDDSRFNLIGYDQENGILDLQTVDGREMEYGNYYMTSAAAQKYGVAAGDEFCFYNTVSMEKTTIVISGIVENDILPLVITSKQNVADIIGRPVNEYNVIISRDPLDIPSELLTKETSLQDYSTMAKSLSATAGIVLKLLKVLGVLICLLIVTMMSGMIVEESRRNISMLEVLGYRNREVQHFVLTSNHMLVPIGFVIGVPLGYLTSYSMILAAAQSSGMVMSLPVKALTILSSFIFVLAAYGLAMLLSGRKFRKVNMAESLKMED